MTIEEVIKEAFSQGWNASHECATDFDYEYALRNCLSELDSKVKKLNILAVSRSLPLEIEKDLGDTKRKFLLWHDGGEWIVSLNGDMKQCKTLSELVCRNDD